ncbi:UNVERIFIED_CONTAM: putative glycerol-3-phosphate acyltransferase 2 [Sesamum calycinum]|uniref:Glycerol-3-phosphate acyltransferase 2 n=1 Tax=Sesamum calycinum TaxID=2727403 RepID=A0AAW2NW71_9LAMI
MLIIQQNKFISFRAAASVHHDKTKKFMAPKAFPFSKLALLFSAFLDNFRDPRRNLGKNCSPRSQFEFQNLEFLGQRHDLDNQVLIFHAETVLLRSSSLFPYFMLVAFEAGSLIRALILFVLYPFICLCHQDLALEVMVFVCFLGLKKERFIEGRAVLPKFFLEDVGRESFEVLRRCKLTIAVSDLPQVMVESFLKDYLDVDFVVGRDLKACGGCFVGLMEERRDYNAFQVVKMSPNVIGVGCFRKCFDHEWFPIARPTFWATLAMFMWLPMGFTLGIIRAIVTLSSLPFEIKSPILHFTGAQAKISNPELATIKTANGALYVCNHRTLLDPLVLSYCLRTPLTAVVYSLSQVSEIISPIKTARLTRNREQDAALMRKLLSQGNLVICPEGTTCREPYLLRFSPLFTEISDLIYPVALDCHVSMFYGTTARGFKSLDPLFFSMNPRTTYSVHFLNMVRRGAGDENGDVAGTSNYKMANLVQSMIAGELGFSCTKLTRKDKYLVLAANEGIVRKGGELNTETETKNVMKFENSKKLCDDNV